MVTLPNVTSSYRSRPEIVNFSFIVFIDLLFCIAFSVISLDLFSMFKILSPAVCPPA